LSFLPLFQGIRLFGNEREKERERERRERERERIILVYP